MREKNMLAERERVNDEKLAFIKRVVERQRQTSETYESAINKVIQEQEEKQKKAHIRDVFRSALQEDNGSFGLEVFSKALGEHYDNVDAIRDIFLESFITITDICRKVGEDSSAQVLKNIQELIINNINFKYLYWKGKIDYPSKEKREKLK